jgi:hypothetical protein
MATGGTQFIPPPSRVCKSGSGKGVSVWGSLLCVPCPPVVIVVPEPVVVVVVVVVVVPLVFVFPPVPVCVPVPLCAGPRFTAGD